MLIPLFLFLFLSIFHRKYLLSRRSKADVLRWSSMLAGVILSPISPLGITMFMVGALLNDEYMRQLRNSKVIYFGGLDGAGKTTHTTTLAGNQRYAALHFYKNPSTTTLSKVKNKVAPSKNSWLGKKTRAYLILIDNLFHIYPQIIWNKLKGKTVLADRYFYDYYLRLKLLGYNVRGLESIYLKMMPKQGVILDIPPELAYDRRKEHPLNYYRLARKSYWDLADRKGYWFIDAEKPFNQVHDEIKKVLGEVTT